MDYSWAKVFGSKIDTKAKEFLDKNNANLFKATEEEKRERYINYQTLTQYYDFYKNTSPELFNEMLKEIQEIKFLNYQIVNMEKEL